MLDWLDTATPKNPPNSAPPEIGHDSGEVQGDTIFPVSRFRETPEIQNREGWKPHGCEVFPVSRFSRFQNRGVPERNGENGPQAGDETQAIPEHLPELLDAVAAILTAGELEHLRAMSGTDPDTVADACRLILTAPPFPTPEDVAELDRRILKLCDLEPWLAGYLPELQAARRRMAPADVALNLAKFAEWIREAETKPGRRAGAGSGELLAP